MERELFVQNIKERCRAKGVKPTVACREAGVGTSFITDINKGQTPSVAKVQMLAQYLGCTVSDLLGEDPTPPDPVRQEFIRLLDGMTAEQQNELFAYMLRQKREQGKEIEKKKAPIWAREGVQYGSVGESSCYIFPGWSWRA